MLQAYPEIKFHINGSWTNENAASKKLAVECPVDGSTIGAVPIATDAVLQHAIDSASAAFKLWRRQDPLLRCEVVQRAATLLRERAEKIAQLSALELGTPVRDGRQYVLRAADILEWDANEGRRLYGRVIPSAANLRQMAIPEPIGVVAAFSPWNVPVLGPCRKIGSAVSAGCSIILKASEETPASAMAVVEAFTDAGIPPGVINLVFGDPDHISRTLIDSPETRMLSFTGSVPIGKKLASMAAAVMKPVVMELGGHAPVIVCADADIEDAAQKCAIAKFRNGGQACIAPTRFYIHDSVYEQFKTAFSKYTAAMVVGSPFDGSVHVGPLANERRLQAISALVDEAVQLGAEVVHGGRRIGNAGHFYEPTILARVPAHAAVLSQEPFGPIACLEAFDDIDDVLRKANRLPYGLAGYVFTTDLRSAHRLTDALECGAVAVNHLTVSTVGIPFGGVKESGYGREGGTEGVRGYTVTKTISFMCA